MTIEDINLYPEMNAQIADLFAMSEEPMYLYAAKYIRHLRAENQMLRERLAGTVVSPADIYAINGIPCSECQPVCGSRIKRGDSDANS